MAKRWYAGWVLVLMLLGTVGYFRVTKQAQLEQTFALPDTAKNEPWPVQSGLRIATLRDRIPTVNRVVIVPDEATFLWAMRQWSLKGRWPILIEDNKYTPMFIDRFKPSEVIRLPAVKEPLATGEILRQSMQEAVAAAWNAPDTEALRQQWQQLGWEPPGVVVTSVNDPGWPAAVALASDRGQPLVFVEDNFGQPNDRLSLNKLQELRTRVEQSVKKTGYPYANLGDAIDTVTIVRQLAVKYQSPHHPQVELAVTDGLGRHQKGDRWAVVGWIYGSSDRAVYQAMSAIFLDPQTALLYDSYPKEKPWQEYEMNTAGWDLKKMGFSVKVVQRPESNLQSWRSFRDRGLDFDLILINSKGMKDAFAVGNGDASVKDIPALKFPAIVHLIHSWSATTPDDRDTIAGRWLENGAYLYVGSVHEPFLSAFIPPKLMLRRLQRSSPFLIAARQLQSEPWKITTIGDPLAILGKQRRRISPTEIPIQQP